MGTLLFIPALIGSDQIRSRIGLSASAFVFPTDFDFFEHVAKHQAETKASVEAGAEGPGTTSCDCVLIDEAQFLKQAQVRQLGRVADELKVPVLCFGLRSDFRGEPFEGSMHLLTTADVLSEIKTVCGCGRKATMNQRVADDGAVLAEGEQVQVGGNERYVGKCRKHFWEGILGAQKRRLNASGQEAALAGISGFVEIVTPEKTTKARATCEPASEGPSSKSARLA